jgi:hypothetical protein
MASFYSPFAGWIAALIEKTGREVTFVKPSRVAADNAKPWRADDSADIRVTAKAVIVPFDAEDNPDSVRRGTMCCYVNAPPFDAVLPHKPEDFNTIEDGTDIWNIRKVIVYNPGDTRLLYEMDVER